MRHYYKDFSPTTEDFLTDRLIALHEKEKRIDARGSPPRWLDYAAVVGGILPLLHAALMIRAKVLPNMSTSFQQDLTQFAQSVTPDSIMLVGLAAAISVFFGPTLIALPLLRRSKEDLLQEIDDERYLLTAYHTDIFKKPIHHRDQTPARHEHKMASRQPAHLVV